jgi:selenide,water dikinase
MKPNTPAETDIVLVGGGHSHVAVLKSFGMRPAPGVRLTLIARELLAPYSGMLPGLIAGHYTFGQAHIDLEPLARFAGARLYHAPATRIDAARKLVHVEGRPPVPYDLLSVDAGSLPAASGIAGAAEHALPVKPVDRFLVNWQDTEARLVAQDTPIRIAVVGAGAGGVELALCIEHRLRQHRAVPADRLSITVLTDREAPLPGHSEAVRQRLQAALYRANIALLTGARVERIEAGAVHCADGRTVETDATLLLTHAGAPGWIADSGLKLDEDGFILVDDNLTSLSHPDVFAAGDIAHFDSRPLPKSGVYAVRQGPFLAENLRRAAQGRKLKPYKPQARTLALISTGGRNAIASYGQRALEGRLVWRWKDWIDRRWMRKYQELPEMPAGDGPTDDRGHPLDMRCGGCGAKVASPVLRRVLDRLRPEFGDGVVIGLDAPDDAAVLAPPEGQLLVQTVDQFRAFIDDPLLFGRIAANHALGDIHAMGARPASAQALVTLAYAREDKLEADLHAMLTGALEVFRAEGVALVGGHTAEGAETALGFAVNGFAREDELLRKGGLKPGDKLILTKPLGTGALFAADMRARAPGPAIAEALDAMQLSNGPPAAVLKAHGAAACTDVTGFGLAGHLIEMLNASGASAEIALDAVPALAGAIAAVRAGIVSSLQPGNETFAGGVAGIDLGEPAHRLLFDPQTAGGLLAGVPADRAESCLAALRAGPAPDAAVVGEVTESGATPVRLA